MKRPRRPAWTVSANVKSPEGDNGWIGRLWMFFDDEAVAQRVYEDLVTKGECPTMRPFYASSDDKHLHVLQMDRYEPGR